MKKSETGVALRGDPETGDAAAPGISTIQGDEGKKTGGTFISDLATLVAQEKPEIPKGEISYLRVVQRMHCEMTFNADLKPFGLIIVLCVLFCRFLEYGNLPGTRPMYQEVQGLKTIWDGTQRFPKQDLPDYLKNLASVMDQYNPMSSQGLGSSTPRLLIGPKTDFTATGQLMLKDNNSFMLGNNFSIVMWTKIQVPGSENKKIIALTKEFEREDNALDVCWRLTLYPALEFSYRRPTEARLEKDSAEPQVLTTFAEQGNLSQELRAAVSPESDGFHLVAVTYAYDVNEMISTVKFGVDGGPLQETGPVDGHQFPATDCALGVLFLGDDLADLADVLFVPWGITDDDFQSLWVDGNWRAKMGKLQPEETVQARDFHNAVNARRQGLKTSLKRDASFLESWVFSQSQIDSLQAAATNSFVKTAYACEIGSACAVRLYPVGSWYSDLQPAVVQAARAFLVPATTSGCLTSNSLALSFPPATSGSSLKDLYAISTLPQEIGEYRVCWAQDGVTTGVQVGTLTLFDSSFGSKVLLTAFIHTPYAVSSSQVSERLGNQFSVSFNAILNQSAGGLMLDTSGQPCYLRENPIFSGVTIDYDVTSPGLITVNIGRDIRAQCPVKWQSGVRHIVFTFSSVQTSPDVFGQFLLYVDGTACGGAEDRNGKARYMDFDQVYFGRCFAGEMGMVKLFNSTLSAEAATQVAQRDRRCKEVDDVEWSDPSGRTCWDYFYFRQNVKNVECSAAAVEHCPVACGDSSNVCMVGLPVQRDNNEYHLFPRDAGRKARVCMAKGVNMSLVAERCQRMADSVPEASSTRRLQSLVTPALRDNREAMRRETVGQLRKKAHALGADEDEIDNALDFDDPKAALIKLIIQLDKDPVASFASGTKKTAVANDFKLRRSLTAASDFKKTAVPIRRNEAAEARSLQTAEQLALNGYTVVTWGSIVVNASEAARLTSGVAEVTLGFGTGAALKLDKSVVPIGLVTTTDDDYTLSYGVVEIAMGYGVGVARKDTGEAVTFGGGVNPDPAIAAVASQLTSGVTQVVGCRGPCKSLAARKEDGSVIVWGANWDADLLFNGVTYDSISAQLTSGVTSVALGTRAGGVLKDDGSVVTWGDATLGGDSSAVAAKLTSEVKEIMFNRGAGVALTAAGGVVSWGTGAQPSYIVDQLDSMRTWDPIADVVVGAYEVAARTQSGKAIMWGGQGVGAIASQLESLVLQVALGAGSGAARRYDGSVVVWGVGANYVSVSIQSQLTSDVVNIDVGSGVGAARKADGSVVMWGDPSHGGSLDSVASQLAPPFVARVDLRGMDFAVALVTCSDSSNGATDQIGDGCPHYSLQPGACGWLDDADFSASSMCCGCKTTCDNNNDFGALDKNNYGCNAYTVSNQETWCGQFDDKDFSSVSMCCACPEGQEQHCADIDGRWRIRYKERFAPTPRPTVIPTVTPTPAPTVSPTTPTPAPTAAPTQETYDLTRYGLTSCPSGFLLIDTSQECQSVVTELSYTYQSGVLSDVPSGCYRSKDNSVLYFNEKVASTPPGPANIAYAPVCRQFCVDLSSAKDATNVDGCSTYTAGPSGFCGKYDDDDFSSWSMCCVCVDPSTNVRGGQPSRRLQAVDQSRSLQAVNQSRRLLAAYGYRYYYMEMTVKQTGCSFALDQDLCAGSSVSSGTVTGNSLFLPEWNMNGTLNEIIALWNHGFDDCKSTTRSFAHIQWTKVDWQPSCPCMESSGEPVISCNVVWADINTCVTATMGDGERVLYPADFGQLCKRHLEPGQPACFDIEYNLEKPKLDRAGWCNDAWCYVDPCHCDASDITTSTYFTNPLYYSYRTCTGYTAGLSTTVSEFCQVACSSVNTGQSDAEQQSCNSPAYLTLPRETCAKYDDADFSSFTHCCGCADLAVQACPDGYVISHFGFWVSTPTTPVLVSGGAQGEACAAYCNSVTLCAGFSYQQATSTCTYAWYPVAIRQYSSEWTSCVKPTVAASTAIWYDWDVTTGGCQLAINSTSCVTSSNYPSDYNNRDFCEIRPMRAGKIIVEQFSTESSYDYLYVNNVGYSGQTAPLQVEIGMPMTWSSDRSGAKGGWKVCLEDAWEVTSGNACVVEGHCLSFSDLSFASSIQNCVVRANRNGVIKVDTFGGMSSASSLWIANQKFTTQAGLEGFKVETDTQVAWYPAGGETWKICLFEECADDATFSLFNEPCSNFAGRDCTTIHLDGTYTPAQKNDLVAKCPKSCGICTSATPTIPTLACPSGFTSSHAGYWRFHYAAQGQMTIQQCANLCVDDFGCLGIDYDTRALECRTYAEMKGTVLSLGFLACQKAASADPVGDNVIVSMIVEGVDYDKLTEEYLITSFKDALKEGMSLAAAADEIVLQLSPGSVKVLAGVKPKDGDVQTMRGSMSLPTIPGLIVIALEAMPGIERATTGSIAVVVDSITLSFVEVPDDDPIDVEAQDTPWGASGSDMCNTFHRFTVGYETCPMDFSPFNNLYAANDWTVFFNGKEASLYCNLFQAPTKLMIKMGRNINIRTGNQGATEKAKKISGSLLEDDSSTLRALSVSPSRRAILFMTGLHVAQYDYEHLFNCTPEAIMLEDVSNFRVVDKYFTEAQLVEIGYEDRLKATTGMSFLPSEGDVEQFALRQEPTFEAFIPELQLFLPAVIWQPKPSGVQQCSILDTEQRSLVRRKEETFFHCSNRTNDSSSCDLRKLRKVAKRPFASTCVLELPEFEDDEDEADAGVASLDAAKWMKQDGDAFFLRSLANQVVRSDGRLKVPQAQLDFSRDKFVVVLSFIIPAQNLISVVQISYAMDESSSRGIVSISAMKLREDPALFQRWALIASIASYAVALWFLLRWKIGYRSKVRRGKERAHHAELPLRRKCPFGNSCVDTSDGHLELYKECVNQGQADEDEEEEEVDDATMQRLEKLKTRFSTKMVLAVARMINPEEVEEVDTFLNYMPDFICKNEVDFKELDAEDKYAVLSTILTGAFCQYFYARQHFSEDTVKGLIATRPDESNPVEALQRLSSIQKELQKVEDSGLYIIVLGVMWSLLIFITFGFHARTGIIVRTVKTAFSPISHLLILVLPVLGLLAYTALQPLGAAQAEMKSYSSLLLNQLDFLMGNRPELSFEDEDRARLGSETVNGIYQLAFLVIVVLVIFNIFIGIIISAYNKEAGVLDSVHVHRNLFSDVLSWVMEFSLSIRRGWTSTRKWYLAYALESGFIVIHFEEKKKKYDELALTDKLFELKFEEETGRILTGLDLGKGYGRISTFSDVFDLAYILLKSPFVTDKTSTLLANDCTGRKIIVRTYEDGWQPDGKKPDPYSVRDEIRIGQQDQCIKRKVESIRMPDKSKQIWEIKLNEAMPPQEKDSLVWKGQFTFEEKGMGKMKFTFKELVGLISHYKGFDCVSAPSKAIMDQECKLLENSIDEGRNATAVWQAKVFRQHVDLERYNRARQQREMFGDDEEFDQDFGEWAGAKNLIKNITLHDREFQEAVTKFAADDFEMIEEPDLDTTILQYLSRQAGKVPRVKCTNEDCNNYVVTAHCSMCGTQRQEQKADKDEESKSELDKLRDKERQHRLRMKVAEMTMKISSDSRLKNLEESMSEVRDSMHLILQSVQEAAEAVQFDEVTADQVGNGGVVI